MKYYIDYPVIDLEKTGENIRYLREKKGLSVNDIREFMGFLDPQAVYSWQKGKYLPSVDHLCALSKLFGVSMDEILVLQKPVTDNSGIGQRETNAIFGQAFLSSLMQAA